MAADDTLLVTGAAGFVGARVVATLLAYGFRHLRCLVRPGSDRRRLTRVLEAAAPNVQVEVMTGNLLSRDDCLRATAGARGIYHLAAGTGTKSFSDAFLNSTVTVRNLLEAALQQKCLRRFVNVSSFAVYSNRDNPNRGMLDESCPIEAHPETRYEAYCYAKVKQDELVIEYGAKNALPYVILRPGVVYGPGKNSISGRIGIDSFGVFLHLGGSNPIPFTFIDNCAEAIVLAGLRPGIDGQIFNVVDDDLPSSRQFLRLYKKRVHSFKSIYIPHTLSYLLCYLWEKMAAWSDGQLPPAYTTREWSATWKKTRYSNQRIKNLLQWSPRVPTEKGLEQFFSSCRDKQA